MKARVFAVSLIMLTLGLANFPANAAGYSHGKAHYKLSVYDLNHDGYVSKREVKKVHFLKKHGLANKLFKKHAGKSHYKLVKGHAHKKVILVPNLKHSHKRNFYGY